MSSDEKIHQSSLSEGLSIPGLVQDEEPVEQLAFGNETTLPLSAAMGANAIGPASSPGLTQIGSITLPLSHPGMTTPLPQSPEEGTRALLLHSQAAFSKARAGVTPLPSSTTALRPPVVIPGKGQPQKKRSIRPPQGRRHVIGISTLALLVIITITTLLIASPLAHELGKGFNPAVAANDSGLKNADHANLNLVAQQATATAVVHQQNDGYVPGSGTGTTNNLPINTDGSPHVWPEGVCTYWANLRYHELTGVWVPWLGNAYQWVDGARQAGWNVSQSPHVPSIIVLMPGVQGASGYGHVAVVESMVNDQTVNTSNMNWYTNGGGFDIVSYYNFSVGSGVYFVWA